MSHDPRSFLELRRLAGRAQRSLPHSPQHDGNARLYRTLDQLFGEATTPYALRSTPDLA